MEAIEKVFSDDPQELERWRKELQLSFEELATRAGITAPYLNMIVKGKRAFVEPTKTHLWDAIHVLRCQLAAQTEEIKGRSLQWYFDNPFWLANLNDPKNPYQGMTEQQLKDEELKLAKSQVKTLTEYITSLNQQLAMHENRTETNRALKQTLEDALRLRKENEELREFQAFAIDLLNRETTLGIDSLEVAELRAEFARRFKKEEKP